MRLTAGFDNARDLFEKLKRDAEKLENEVNPDNMFNFIVTAFSICDWVEKDTRVLKRVKKKLGSLREDTIIEICQDIANSSKHFVLRPKAEAKKHTDQIIFKHGFGQGGFDRGPFGVGESDITIKGIATRNNPQGIEVNIVDFKEKVLEVLKKFLDDNQL
ncbi:MAG: hypothetical protein ACRCU2_15825 [Planktothrix sp.]